jgi:hypothetical protein
MKQKPETQDLWITMVLMFPAFASCRDGRYAAVGIDAHPQSSLTLPAEKCLFSAIRSLIK